MQADLLASTSWNNVVMVTKSTPHELLFYVSTKGALAVAFFPKCESTLTHYPSHNPVRKPFPFSCTSVVLYALTAKRHY